MKSRKTFFKKPFLLLLLGFSLLSFQLLSCGNSDCPLPFPFCGGSFPLNTQETTPYGPAWADVVLTTSDWIPCFGPYALCFYAECTPDEGSGGELVNCPCFSAFGTNYVDINAILNNDVYNETKTFCTANPDSCRIPNEAPVCQSLNSGSFMQGATTFSTFSFYNATEEPIGNTDCLDPAIVYGGCMTAPCYGPTTPGSQSGTTMIECLCPTYVGPHQLGKDNLSCDVSPNVYSAAYNLITPPSGNEDFCERIDGCVPDAPADHCGCGLYVPGTTAIPPGSDIDCNKVCEEYDTCRSGSIELGYTCDATLCTTENSALVADACNGLQNCDLSEIFKAESAAQCSCCASQLCGCSPDGATSVKISTLNAAQRAVGSTPQCDINGTLCGIQH